MSDLKGKIISKLENRETPYACLIKIENLKFDKLAETFKEICKEKELKFILLPPMFPIEKNKLRDNIEKYIDISHEIVMLSKTNQLPHYENIIRTLEPNMFLFVVYTKGEVVRGVWEVIK
ncbi:MAG: hypothetical protein KAT49_00880 [Methanomicrobia archaeon]|nr:hypothetical protein [Methanomicrobia archaeon]